MIILGDISFKLSRWFLISDGEIKNWFVKFANSLCFSIIIPFNSINTITLLEFSSPKIKEYFLFLLSIKLRNNETNIIIVIIDKKKAFVLMKIFQKIAILIVYRKIKKN